LASGREGGEGNLKKTDGIGRGISPVLKDTDQTNRKVLLLWARGKEGRRGRCTKEKGQKGQDPLGKTQ